MIGQNGTSQLWTLVLYGLLHAQDLSTVDGMLHADAVDVAHPLVDGIGGG